jgi:hypothetical protein
MRRLGVVAASAVFALTALVQGGTAQAAQKDVEWCAEDPVIVVFGAQFKVVTTVQAPASATTRFAYTLVVPSNAVGRTNVNWPNSKFSTTTVDVSYSGDAWSGSGPLTVSGTVTVTAPDGAAVTVNISGPSVAAGTVVGYKAGDVVPFSTSATPNGAATGGANAQ